MRAGSFLAVAENVSEPAPVRSRLLNLSLPGFWMQVHVKDTAGVWGSRRVPCALHVTPDLQECEQCRWGLRPPSATPELTSLTRLLMHLEFVKCPGHSQSFWLVFVAHTLWSNLQGLPLGWHVCRWDLPMT